jgi:UDP-glucose 4-epimerase
MSVALSPGTAGQVYNLGTGVGTPFIDMVHLVAESIPGTEVQYLSWPQDRYFVETGDFIADISKITAATDWAPRTSLQEGIGRTIDYYQQNREQYW